MSETTHSFYGSFWARLLAFLIDFVVLAVVLSLVTFLLQLSGCILCVDVVMFVPWGWPYFAFFESSRYQATPGKRVLKLYVTNLEGQRISFWRATVRFLAKILSVSIFFIGVLMILWTKHRQGLHDFIAGTFVRKGIRPL